MRVETPWGPWEHISPAEMASVMSGFGGSWWIGGGYAIEAFVGRHFREHGDIDVGVLRRDHKVLQVHLREWELECADPPGILRPWVPGEELTPEIHDIWARRSSDDAWRFQFMLDNSVGD
ncbi:MAG: amino acid transporter, partial [Tepidiformaceae bacterium]